MSDSDKTLSMQSGSATRLLIEATIEELAARGLTIGLNVDALNELREALCVRWSRAMRVTRG